VPLDTRVLATPHGPARLLQRRALAPRATLVLTHGAGGGIDAPDLKSLADSLPRRGITVSLIEMPWRVAGRRVAAPPPVLDECMVAAVSRLRPRTPMVLGGRSAGARVACRTGRRLGAIAVLALAFPLHPPRRPVSSRAAELTGARLPVLVVQGERDAFGAPAEFPVGTALSSVSHADHSFAVPRTAGVRRDDVLREVAVVVHDWIGDRLQRPG
jgi:hypothetical protein